MFVFVTGCSNPNEIRPFWTTYSPNVLHDLCREGGEIQYRLREYTAAARWLTNLLAPAGAKPRPLKPRCFVKKKTETNPLDIYIGKRIKEARIHRGIGQAELGKSLTDPVTFQQIQKYERGANRLSVSRLYEFAEILGFAYDYFLPDSQSGEQYRLNDDEIKLIESFRALSQKNQNALATFLENTTDK